MKSSESFFEQVNIHIIQCDSVIQEDHKITNEEEFDDYIGKMVLKGFGGTDFRPVFDYVDSLKDFNNLKGLIYFTDGWGLFPAKNRIMTRHLCLLMMILTITKSRHGQLNLFCKEMKYKFKEKKL